MHPLFFALGKKLSVEVRPSEVCEVAACSFGKLWRAGRQETGWFDEQTVSVFNECMEEAPWH